MGLFDLLKNGITGAAAPRSTIWEIEKSLMGSKYDNPDGTSRQAILKSCKVGDDIVFKPAPTKEYPDLIGAFTKKNKQVGSVPYDVINTIKEKYAGFPMSANIIEIRPYGGALLCYVSIKVFSK